MVIKDCQSVMSMKAELGCVIDSTNPDIIVEPREIWLSSSIAISSSDFSCWVHCLSQGQGHRAHSYGGVLLAHKSSYKSHQLFLDNDCEIIVCQINLSDNPLIVLVY